MTAIDAPIPPDRLLRRAGVLFPQYRQEYVPDEDGFFSYDAVVFECIGHINPVICDEIGMFNRFPFYEEVYNIGIR